MKVGITGASGHVGATLCRMMLEKGYQIKAMVYNNQSLGIDGLTVERFDGGVLDKHAVEEFVSDCDAVVHLAALISIDGDPDGMVRKTNFDGTFHVIEACLNKQIRLIYFSTIHAMNPHPLDEVLDETRELCGPNWKGSIYDRSKSDAEKAVLEMVNNGLDAIVIAPTSMMGPNDFAPSLLGQAIIDIYNNALPALVAGGYDWVDVRDVCAGTIAALERGRTGEKYLMGGEFLTVKQLADIIGELTGRKVPKVVLPTWVARIGVPFEKLKSRITGKSTGFTHEALTALVHSNELISSNKAKRELGYRARPIRTSLKDSIAWFKKAGKIK